MRRNPPACGDSALMEEAGPPGPKVVRLLYFAGAGFMFTIAVNKWRELERSSMEKQRQSLQTYGDHKLLAEGPTNVVPKATK